MTRLSVLLARLRTIRAQYALARALGYAPARAVAFIRATADIWLFNIL